MRGNTFLWVTSFRSALRLVCGRCAVMSALEAVPEVIIDPEGVYKYILVRVNVKGSGIGEYRDIVRGTKSAEFHNHIFEKINPELQTAGFECAVLGGGKIEHNSKDKKIRIFGDSMGYGKADHSITAEKLKKAFSDYVVIWTDDKK